MKYLIIDDEHELYKVMFADLFKTNKYSVSEIPRMVVPSLLKPLYKLHYDDRINRRVKLPGKMLWKKCYELHSFPFDANEKYWVIFLNGSLRYHFSIPYLARIKKNNPNVKLAMILYDSLSNPASARAVSMLPVFDFVFSFDENDCRTNGFERIYSTFSIPRNIQINPELESAAFFIGFGVGRLEILQQAFERITSEVQNCKFYIAGVHAADRRKIPGVEYNTIMSYKRELQMAYNSHCIVEILKEGQTGITLRTCEAIAFNKKLLTNNLNIKTMPFYDSRYMSVFSKPEEIDTEFIKTRVPVRYSDNDFFSPLKIIERLERVDW